MRSIKKIHKAEDSPISDLVTHRALPIWSVKYIDPFLFLNHHGPQTYPPDNYGLPFGPHPHRGMETVTFILDGDISHKDSSGHNSVINAGGVQWMTAGRGVIHAEVSSELFMKEGGKLEILQLWINLPAALKMTSPDYKGLQKEEIPALALDDGKVIVNLVSGSWDGHEGAFTPLTTVQLNTIHFQTGGTIAIDVPATHNIFFYVIRGKLEVNDTNVTALQLVEFKNDATTLVIRANEESILLFGHALPLNEPVVSQGPFVMNSQQQIMEAYDDYRNGKFGIWK